MSGEKTHRYHKKLWRMEGTHAHNHFLSCRNGMKQSRWPILEENAIRSRGAAVSRSDDFRNIRIVENGEIRTAQSPFVIAIITRTPSVLAVQAASALFHASAVSCVEFMDNWYICGLTRLYETDVGFGYVALVSKFKRPIGVGAWIPCSVPLVKPRIRIRRVEMGALKSPCI
jgi:hypothetical protein